MYRGNFLLSLHCIFLVFVALQSAYYKALYRKQSVVTTLLRQPRASITPLLSRPYSLLTIIKNHTDTHTDSTLFIHV